MKNGQKWQIWPIFHYFLLISHKLVRISRNSLNKTCSTHFFIPNYVFFKKKNFKKFWVKMAILTCVRGGPKMVEKWLFRVMELGKVLYDPKKCADHFSPNNHGLILTIKGWFWAKKLRFWKLKTSYLENGCELGAEIVGNRFFSPNLL